MAAEQLFRFFFLLASINISYEFQILSDTIHARRVENLVKINNNPEEANRWRNELTTHGNWTDVDYTHGCPADRAVWGAPEHVNRLITMACLWYNDVSDQDLLQKINMALNHWFDNDFSETDCINAGGRAKCPCGTPGFWNPNWWYQMILMPRLIGNACLILQTALTEFQSQMCHIQIQRSYERIDGDPNGYMGGMTGANLLDVTYSGTSLALLTTNESLLMDSLTRSYNESLITPGFQDGIKVDGSFMQHSGQLLTGSYGAVFFGAMIKIFTETQGTNMEPPKQVQSDFLTLLNGSEWFVYRKNDTADQFSPILSWEYSVIGRSISHKYKDWRGIGFNPSQLTNATESWANHEVLLEIVNRLSSGSTVNPGSLTGTRYFHVTDYLVHRGPGYIVTLKMYSSRTTNSECHNDQNPFGFHLSDGSIFTYLDGNEYTDVAGAWDWYLIPGTTVDYEGTTLQCNQVERKGKESFVGGIGLGESQVGVAVMNHTNPNTGALSWAKTFFFFPNLYVVQFAGKIRHNSTNGNVVVTTLDQRHRSGGIYIDGDLVTEDKIRKLAENFFYHDNVIYEFLSPVNLTVDTISRQSDWDEIGSSEGNATLNLMTAFFELPEEHEDLAYMVYLGKTEVEYKEFLEMRKRGKSKIKILETESPETKMATAVVRGAISGEVGSADRAVSMVFLTAGEYYSGLEDIRVVETDIPILLIIQRKENNNGWKLALAEPTQTFSGVFLRITVLEEVIELNVELPTGDWAGSTVLQEF